MRLWWLVVYLVFVVSAYMVGYQVRQGNCETYGLQCSGPVW